HLCRCADPPHSPIRPLAWGLLPLAPMRCHRSSLRATSFLLHRGSTTTKPPTGRPGSVGLRRPPLIALSRGRASGAHHDPHPHHTHRHHGHEEDGHRSVRGHAHSEHHGPRHGHSHSHGHGHSHSHGEGHDPHVHLLGGCHDQSHAVDLAEMKGEAMRVTLLGLGCNLFLGGLQLISGSYCHSAALTSDAWHTLTDSFADLITLGVVQLTLRPPGPSFPFGRGKMDSLAALGVSGIMATTGVSTMRFSGETLAEALALGMEEMGNDHGGHSHSHGHLHSHGADSLFEDGRVNQIAVGACLLTIASKEGLYRITRRAAERLNSSVLLANAWHHRSDAMSSGMVLIGVLCRVFVHSAFDPMAGAVMSSIILRISWGIGRRAIAELLDMQLPPTDLTLFKDSLKDALQKAAPRLQLASLHGRRAGPEVHLVAALTPASQGAVSALTAAELMQLDKSLLSELHLGGHRTVRSLRLEFRDV
ncbi:Mitochondrial metal transporter 2, partial [Durusdinium trenchii]